MFCQRLVITDLPVTLVLAADCDGCRRVPGAAKKGTSGMASASVEEKAALGNAPGQLVRA